MRVALLFFVVAMTLPVGTLHADAAIETLETPDGVRYSIWPNRKDQPAPTMFVLAATMEDALGSAYFRQAGEMLAGDGWLLVSIDLPCHGSDVREGERSGLAGWRERIERGDDVIKQATSQLSQVLDDLIAKGLTDPERVAALGTSRGGFVAFHFAAVDERVKCAAGFAPLTDLAAISEFRGAEQNALVERLALESQADALAERAIWLVIGDHDERVSTDAAMRFAQRVIAASRERQLSPRVDLHVVAEPRSHAVPAGYAELAAQWFRRQFSNP